LILDCAPFQRTKGQWIARNAPIWNNRPPQPSRQLPWGNPDASAIVFAAMQRVVCARLARRLLNLFKSAVKHKTDQRPGLNLIKQVGISC